MGNLHIKNSIMGNSVCNDNDAVYVHAGVCDQYVCDLNIGEVQEVKLLTDVDSKYTGVNQRLALRKLTENT